MMEACKGYDETTIVPISEGLDADARMINDAIYSMLAGETSGQAHDIVRSGEHRRCGITTWVRLRERFKQTEMTQVMDVINFKWQGQLEERWRSFTRLVRSLSKPMADDTLEALVITGMKSLGATAVHEALRLRHPQPWESITATIENYVKTIHRDEEPVPMDIGQVQNGKKGKNREKGKGKGGKGKGKGEAGKGKGHHQNTWESKKPQYDRGAGQRSNGNDGSGCFKCGQIGHYKRECPQRSAQAVELIMAVEEEKPKRGVMWLIDSGADIHVMPEHIYNQLGSAASPLMKTDVTLNAANGKRLDVAGTATLYLETKCGQTLDVQAIIARGATTSLMSAKRMQAAGYTLILNKDGSSLEWESHCTPLDRDERGRDVLITVLSEVRKTPHALVLAASAQDNEARGSEDVIEISDSEGDVLEKEPRARENEPADYEPQTGWGDDDTDDEDEHAQRARVAHPPKEPTEKERADHEATHLPYAPWCVSCVMGRGRGRQHKKKKDDEETDVAVVQFDFGFYGGRCYLAGVCTVAKTVFARIVSKKGLAKEALGIVAKCCATWAT